VCDEKALWILIAEENLDFGGKYSYNQDVTTYLEEVQLTGRHPINPLSPPSGGDKHTPTDGYGWGVFAV
jgi:hypothetical protein